MSEEQLQSRDCPRCAMSVLLCPCKIVPKNAHTVMVLTTRQYKEWKRTGKVTSKGERNIRMGANR